VLVPTRKKNQGSGRLNEWPERRHAEGPVIEKNAFKRPLAGVTAAAGRPNRDHESRGNEGAGQKKPAHSIFCPAL